MTDFLCRNPDCTEEDAPKFQYFGRKGQIIYDIKVNHENKLKTLSVTQSSIGVEYFLIPRPPKREEFRLRRMQEMCFLINGR